MQKPRKYIEKRWRASVGSDLTKDHFREPCPGTHHAVCDEKSCNIHKDRHNPECGFDEAVRHIEEDWKDAPALLGVAAMLGTLVLLAYFSSRGTRCPACGARIEGLLQPYTWYRCNMCLSYFQANA